MALNQNPSNPLLPYLTKTNITAALVLGAAVLAYVTGAIDLTHFIQVVVTNLPDPTPTLVASPGVL